MKPWTSGPRELLEHALDHFKSGSAFDYRIAFISIDNSVELMIKTYLGLPKRIRQSDGPSRRKLSEASNSFPELLDLLEDFGSEKIEGIELGDIEWYHRIRNTLYHDGNGVTVDKDRVDSYLQIAIILFNSLFEEELNEATSQEPSSLVGEIVLRSSQLEHNLNALYSEHFPEDNSKRVSTIKVVKKLQEKGVISKELAQQIYESRAVRNEAVHNSGEIDVDKFKKTPDVLSSIASQVLRFL